MTRRRQHVVALAFLALVIVTAAWRGFDAWLGAMLVIVLVFGYGHTAYLAIVQRRAAARPVTVENGHLVQRDSRGEVVAMVDLTASLATDCVHDASDWVLYKVRQGRTVLWISVPSNDDGTVVRALGLSWPPRAPSGLRYL